MQRLMIIVLYFATLWLGSSGQSFLLAEETPTYRCGIANGFPPYQYTNKNGHGAGLDFEVATLVFKTAGLKVAFVHDDWENLLFNLIHKRDLVDMLCGAEITPERQKHLDFTIPYHSRRAVLFILKDSPIKNIEELFGKMVAGDLHSSFETLLDKKRSNIRIIKTSTKEESFNKLKDKSVVAVISPIEVGLFLSKKLNLEVKIIDINKSTSATAVAIAVKLGNQKMLDILNPVIKKLISSGKIDKILKKYQ